jgi:hypothetical protein
MHSLTKALLWRRATDPRDKVFACLGLVNRPMADAILVDYSQTPVDVYIKVASYLLKDEGRLDLLLHNSDQIPNVDSIPSWVPQWNWKSLYKPLKAQFKPSKTQKLASSWFASPGQGSRPLPENLQRLMSWPSTCQDPNFTFDICPREAALQRSTRVPTGPTLPCLRIRAHYLDTIVSIVPTHYDSSLLGIAPPAYGLRGCVRCDIEGRHPSLQWNNHEEDGYEAYFLKNHAEDEDDSYKSIHNIFEAQKAFRVMLGLDRPRKEWVSFLTDQFVGFACAGDPRNELQLGDSIWILAGLNVPIVLRRVDGYYVLIKECHLFRATESHECFICGGTEPWPMLTQIIDIW